jgi:hypothetical protein
MEILLLIFLILSSKYFYIYPENISLTLMQRDCIRLFFCNFNNVASNRSFYQKTLIETTRRFKAVSKIKIYHKGTKKEKIGFQFPACNAFGMLTDGQVCALV